MKYLFILLSLFTVTGAVAQNEEALLQKVRTKLEKVTDYVAEGSMKLDVSFIKAPPSNVTVYYKKPDKFRVKKEDGISILPKGGVSVNVASLLASKGYQTIPGGASVVDGVPVKIVKLIPTDDASDVVLSVLHIDEKTSVIRKAVVTTRQTGTYEVQLSYGAYTAWGLPDKVVFLFNTSDYKLPKGVTFEYEKGGEKKAADKPKSNKGKVEITYARYRINKGVDEKEFQ
ncbi:MAG: hypothetical protein EOO14_08375 [Chitinophagaceae bacterium]|nr:MAG: hypothetical protein EOO14_08375 [Chitinophagaceae bacterium]